MNAVLQMPSGSLAEALATVACLVNHTDEERCQIPPVLLAHVEQLLSQTAMELQPELPTLLKRACRLSFQNFIAEFHLRGSSESAGPAICIQEFALEQTRWMVGLELEDAHGIIDAMLGAEPTPSHTDRSLTDLEYRLLARFSQWLIERFSQALEPGESPGKPQLSSEQPSHHDSRPTCDSYSAFCEFKLGLESNLSSTPRKPITLVLGIPLRHLAQSILTSTVPKSADEQQTDRTLVVDLARSTIACEDLKNLQVGDLITTEQHVNEPLLATTAGGILSLAVRPGALRGRKAVELCASPHETGEPTGDRE